MRTLARLAHEEDGQALLWGAGVIVITMALFYGAVDMGLLVLGKIQAQTAADSAAMSASALKAGVHNTRSLAYRAASGQVALSRMQLVQATGLALQGLVDPKADKAKFKDALERAIHHRKNVLALHTGLKNYNAWLAGQEVGKAGVRKAAEIAYHGNIGVLGVMDSYNLTLIKREAALAENGGGGMIGGTLYTEEAIDGAGGKSFVAVEPRVNALGSGLLGYGKQAALGAWASAGPVDVGRAYGDKFASLNPATGYGINWYTVRLMAIGKGGEANE